MQLRHRSNLSNSYRFRTQTCRPMGARDRHVPRVQPHGWIAAFQTRLLPRRQMKLSTDATRGPRRHSPGGVPWLGRGIILASSSPEWTDRGPDDLPRRIAFQGGHSGSPRSGDDLVAGRCRPSDHKPRQERSPRCCPTELLRFVGHTIWHLSSRPRWCDHICGVLIIFHENDSG